MHPKMGRRVWAAVLAVALGSLFTGSGHAGPPLTLESAAVLNGHSNSASKFCLETEWIKITIECQQDDLTQGSSCSFGSVLLTGSKTYRLDRGDQKIKPGCYTQKLVDSRVSGDAVLTSKIRYVRFLSRLPPKCREVKNSCHM